MSKPSNFTRVALSGKITVFVMAAIIWGLYDLVLPISRRLEVSPASLVVVAGVFLVWLSFAIYAAIKYGTVYEANNTEFVIRYTLMRLIYLGGAGYSWPEVFFVVADRTGCWLRLGESIRFISSAVPRYGEIVSVVKTRSAGHIDLPPSPRGPLAARLQISEGYLLKVRLGVRQGLTAQVTGMLKDALQLDSATAGAIVAEIAAAEARTEGR